MARDAWEQLIERYADGKQICNCGQAYYSLDGVARTVGGDTINNHPHCKYGCSANQHSAKGYIAERVLAEIKEHQGE